MFLVQHPTVFISRNLFGSSSHVSDLNTRNKLLTAKLLNQNYRYLRKAFSKFYRRHFD